jgi:hypothetical protein
VARVLPCIAAHVYILTLFLTPSASLSPSFASLSQETLQAFTSYVSKTEAQNAETLRSGPFLWVDGFPPEDRAAAFARLRAGEVEMRRLSKSKDAEIPGGMIHNWEGIAFIPGVKVDDVLKILEDYDDQSTYYAPDVAKSRIETHDGDHFLVFLQFRRHKIVTVVLNTEHAITYYRDSPTRAHSRSCTVRISQVENPGSPSEREKPPGDDDGFLWRMDTWWRLDERDGGVYVQSQAVTLTRDIPTGLGWLIEPFISKIPEETLQFTLNATRQAVLSHAPSKH